MFKWRKRLTESAGGNIATAIRKKKARLLMKSEFGALDDAMMMFVYSFGDDVSVGFPKEEEGSIRSAAAIAKEISQQTGLDIDTVLKSRDKISEETLNKHMYSAWKHPEIAQPGYKKWSDGDEELSPLIEGGGKWPYRNDLLTINDDNGKSKISYTDGTTVRELLGYLEDAMSFILAYNKTMLDPYACLVDDDGPVEVDPDTFVPWTDDRNILIEKIKKS